MVDGRPLTIELLLCEGCGGREFLPLAGARGLELECTACCGRAFLAGRESWRYEDFWEDGEPGWAGCSCGGGEFEAALAFTHGEDGPVRAVTVGLRCLRDGTLGVCAAWRGGRPQG
ncbi:hypothetical protein GCM10010302_38410 [Streptomyces polychromogenes]|uniref:Uncharacterized protein n=1 Tax=Streptomyces polychromogenes TaxID=67342 RepID=A0ABP3F2K6_9ACTN